MVCIDAARPPGWLAAPTHPPTHPLSTPPLQALPEVAARLTAIGFSWTTLLPLAALEACHDEHLQRVAACGPTLASCHLGDLVPTVLVGLGFSLVSI